MCIPTVFTKDCDCTLDPTASGLGIENISAVVFDRAHNYTPRICALISVFSSFTKRSSCLQKDKVKWAVCSNVIGVVERSHYSDKNWGEREKETPPRWHLQSCGSSLYDPFESLVPGLSISFCLRPPRPSPSVCQIILLSYFFPPSSLPFPHVFCFFQSLTFSLLQIVRLPGFLQFQNQNPEHFIPSSPTSSSPSSYLSLTRGEDLEGLNLLLLSIPGHCLRVQDAGNHRVLLHLQRETEWDKITKQKNWNCGALLFKVKGQIVIFLPDIRGLSWSKYITLGDVKSF